MKRNLKKNAIILSSVLFLSLLLSSVLFSSCGGNPSKSPVSEEETFIKVPVCAHEIPLRFLESDESEILKIENLPEGTYVLFHAELRIDGKVKDMPVRFELSEKFMKNDSDRSARPTYIHSHQLGCASAKAAIDSGTAFNYEVEAPRVIKKDRGMIDSVFRKFGLSARSRSLSPYFLDEMKVIGKDERGNDKVELQIRKNPERDFDQSLEKYWEEIIFVHTGVRRYELRARRMLDPATSVRLRIVFEKQEGNLLQDGDLFIPLPTVDAIH